MDRIRFGLHTLSESEGAGLYSAMMGVAREFRFQEFKLSDMDSDDPDDYRTPTAVLAGVDCQCEACVSPGKLRPEDWEDYPDWDDWEA